MKHRIWRALRPMRGCDVRRLVGWLTLAVAIPRIVPGGPLTVYPLGILPQETFGWLFLAAATLLLATGGRWRLRLRGRMAALVALVAWSVLLGATTSVTSRLLDAAVMWALLGEITAGREDECV